VSITAIDAEGLILSLSNALDPADRASFEESAKAALAELATKPERWGDGAVFRKLERCWRRYFVPPPAEAAGWEKHANGPMPRKARRRRALDGAYAGQ
jgi:hypothetical protein